MSGIYFIFAFMNNIEKSQANVWGLLKPSAKAKNNRPSKAQ